RIEFPNAPNAKDDNLEEITWDEFFEKFDESNLALLYQEETASGQRSNFNKLVGRETAEAREHGESHASRRHGKRRENVPIVTPNHPLSPAGRRPPDAASPAKPPPTRRHGKRREIVQIVPPTPPPPPAGG